VRAILHFIQKVFSNHLIVYPLTVIGHSIAAKFSEYMISAYVQFVSRQEPNHKQGHKIGFFGRSAMTLLQKPHLTVSNISPKNPIFRCCSPEGAGISVKIFSR
jgi:hypothetical protein